MGLFEFNQNDLLTFFMVLLRFSVMLSVLPFFGEKMIPVSVKVLLSLALSIALYPTLVAKGTIDPASAEIWSAQTFTLLLTIAQEALFGAALGFSTRLIFEAINIGGNIAGSFMGLASASQYDPMAESQTLVLSSFQMAVAMLIFLAIDGHHSVLQASVRSYDYVGIGQVSLGAAFSERIMTLSAQVLRLGMQIAAPMALSIFAINIVYGIFAKAMPQMNILILSFSISALVGMVVLLLATPEFHSVVSQMVNGLGSEMGYTMIALSGK